MFNQNKASNSLRVAIMGAGGIGLIHARVFQSLGAEIASISCSTQNTANQAKKYLATKYGIKTSAFSDINEALDNDINAVSICTPPEYHHEHIIAAFNRNLPVFCEKPLFWDTSSNLQNVQSRLQILRIHPHRQLFVNTSNTVLLQAIGNKLPLAESVNEFSFIFHTRGPNKYENIAVDLFPHGFSMLLNYFGRQEINSFVWETSQNNFNCDFNYGHYHVKFDFHENSKAKKRLSLKLNDNLFERIQEGSGNTYTVYMKDMLNGNHFYSDDPFKVYIDRFIKYCQDDKEKLEDDFKNASANLELMAYCLDKINQQKN